MPTEKDHPAKKLYFEDLAVGDEFCSETHRLDTAQIVAFASQFDPQPFHLDDEAAKHSLFEGLAASGWHTMAITMKLLVQSVPFAGGLIGLGGEIHWPQPTRPTDILHVKSRILEIRLSRSKPDRAIVLLESNTLNQDEVLLQQFNAKVLAFREGSA